MTRRGPGEGSIYQRQDGRWAGSVHIGYEDGKRVRKHVLGHSRAEVKEKLATVQQLHAENRPIPDLRIKVGPYLRQWLDEVARPLEGRWLRGRSVRAVAPGATGVNPLRSVIDARHPLAHATRSSPRAGGGLLPLVTGEAAVNRPDFDGDSSKWRNMESWQTRTPAAPGDRVRASTHPS